MQCFFISKNQQLHIIQTYIILAQKPSQVSLSSTDSSKEHYEFNGNIRIQSFGWVVIFRKLLGFNLSALN